MKVSHFTDNCLFLGNLALSAAAYIIVFRHLSGTPWFSNESHVPVRHAVTTVLVAAFVISPTVYLRKKVFHVDIQ